MGHVLQVNDGDPERAASAVASCQLGVITHAQLELLGIGRGAIEHRLAHGGLHRIFRGVYLLGHAALQHGALEVAAVLACRRRVLVSHESAAGLWAMLAPTTLATVLAVKGRGRSRDGLTVRRTTTLIRDDVTKLGGLPITGPVRTLIDLAAIDHPALERAVSNAHAAGLITPVQLTAELERRRSVRGGPALRQLAGMEARGYTRSQNERRMRAICREARLPQPRTNVDVSGWEVDFYWPRHRLVLEVDAINTHGHARQFERDRRKQNDLVAAGETVLRITDAMLHREPLAVIGTVARSLR